MNDQPHDDAGGGGAREDAVSLLQQAIDLHQARHFKEAYVLYQKVIALKPDYPEAHTCLGNLLKALGRYADSEAAHQSALKLQPDFAQGWSNLGSTLKAAGRLAEAQDCFKQALEFLPGHPELYYNLGNAYLASGAFEKAEECFLATLKVSPDHVRALANIGEALREQGRHQESLENLRRSVALAPDFADAHWNLGLALLKGGDFEAGWKEYEWRRHIPGFAIHRFDAPLWDGGVLNDKTLCLHAEQGMGDALQFVRYVRLARQRAGPSAKILLDAPPALVALFGCLDGVDAVLPHAPAPDPAMPAVDFQAPLMSLPHLLDPHLDHAPALVPYLAPPADLTKIWAEKLSATQSFKIGIGWQGNPAYRADHQRSLPLKTFLPLTQIPGVQLYSLQQGFGHEQLEGLEGLPGAAEKIIDLGANLDRDTGAFVETAAVLANLDLVICSDTALPHLAGAMGKPVWMVLPHVPDWRWGMAATQTPWYPHMRLYRQDAPGDWAGVFDRVAEDLTALING